MTDYIDIVFDGPPGPTAGRFVEVEDPTGASINVGEWVEDGNLWRLRIPDLRAEVERLKADLSVPGRTHCRDCCCARSWKALGVTDYDGRSIPEHIEALKRKIKAWGWRSEMDDTARLLGEAEGLLIAQRQEIMTLKARHEGEIIALRQRVVAAESELDRVKPVWAAQITAVKRKAEAWDQLKVWAEEGMERTGEFMETPTFSGFLLAKMAELEGDNGSL